MKTKRQQEGYLLVDNRAAGLEALPGWNARVFEGATITCSHCQTILIINPLRTRERAWCNKCDHYICDGCGALKKCNNFAKLLDDVESKIIKGLI